VAKDITQHQQKGGVETVTVLGNFPSGLRQVPPRRGTLGGNQHVTFSACGSGTSIRERQLQTNEL
jgi:hypothetical protein